MSEWTKVEQPPASSEELAPIETPSVPPSTAEPLSAVPAVEETAAPPSAMVTTEPPQPKKQLRSDAPRHAAAYRPSGKRGKHPMAAPLGFLVLILALVGVISLLISGWGLLKKAVDGTPLKQEMTEFLNPIMLQNPSAFKNGKEAASSPSCIKAALWQVTETERIRMRQKKDDCRFSADDGDRLLIPEKEVTTAFQNLFGKDFSPDTSLFAETSDAFSIWYDKEAKQYHVPAFTASLYQPVIDTVKKKDGAYLVRVGYVAATDIAVDNQGNDIPPTPDDASVFQQYTIKKTADGYQLTAIADL